MTERIFAPWRIAYVARAHQEEGCLFCRAPQMEDPEALIVRRGERVYVMMNRYPYNPGHLMVAPYRHVEDLGELSPGEMRELWELVVWAQGLLGRVFKPHGFNVGMNLGRAAGAGYSHLHIHVVPRWVGDTNLMPVLADVRVVSQALSETYRALRGAAEGL